MEAAACAAILVAFVLFVQILTVVSAFIMPLCALAGMLELLVLICVLARLRESGARANQYTLANSLVSVLLLCILVVLFYDGNLSDAL